MNKKYNVIFSDRATSMLLRHIKFLANVSKVSAQRLRKEIISEAKALENMPQIFPFMYFSQLPSNKYRKKLVAKRYLLIYQIKDNTVYIDYVVDCREDYQWLLD